MRGTMMDVPLSLQLIFDRGTRLFADREIVTGGVSGAHRYTYREFGRRVHRLANALKQMGLQPGDRVGTFAWNHYRHLELYFAVPLLGGVLHTLNIRLFHDQLTYIINHAGDRFIFVDRSLLPVVRQLEPSFASVEKLVMMDDGGNADAGDALEYENLLSSAAEVCDFPRLDENDAAMLCYTSGTTANPKGVAYSHRALTLHSFGALEADSLAISQRDTVMPIVPMFHANAWGLPYAATAAGAKQVFPGNSLAPERLLQLIQDERVTVAGGVPTIWIGCLPLIQSGAYDVSTLTRIPCGGSAAPRALIASYDAVGLNLLHAWGMTELTPLGTVSTLREELISAPPATQLDYRAMQGLPVFGVELAVLDADGQPVPWDGETMGELVARGPWVTATYFNDERTEGSFTADGWFRTGDVATIHPNGYMQIADRTKDLIRSGGEWISSVALENALMAHPKVQEAAVIAVPDEQWSERPMACVVARPEFRGSLTETELAEHLARQFARWWLPDSYVFVDELPKTSVGKFDKKAMRQKHSVATTAASV